MVHRASHLQGARLGSGPLVPTFEDLLPDFRHKLEGSCLKLMRATVNVLDSRADYGRSEHSRQGFH